MINNAGTSRIKNSTRNMVYAYTAYLLQIVLGFLTRRYFIQFFNAEYLGLNSLFTNVLSLLGLAELGFGAALVFAMYKPMADGDKEKVRQLLHFYKISYTIIGFVVLALGLLVLPFMDYFKAKAPGVDVNFYIVYIIFLTTNVVSYFFAYRRSLLYTSQRNDIESKVGMSMNFLASTLQLIVLILTKNYYLYISVTLVTALLSNLIIYIITQINYAEYVQKPSQYLDKNSRKEINKNVYSLIFHKIGAVVVYSTDSIIIFMCINAVTLGKYSNYILITSYLTTFLGLLLGALRGSIGNSIAKESVDTNYKLFKRLNFLFMWIVSFCSIAFLTLANPFIDTVFNVGASNLTFDLTVLITVSINFYLSNSRTMLGLFKECAGIFYQDRFKPIFESIINLTTSLILVKLIGLPGVILGTIISNITTCLWIEPYVLHKHYFKKSVCLYWVKYIIYTISMLIAGAGTYFVCSLLPSGGIVALILKFAVCAVVPNVILLACLFWMPEFKECVKWGVGIIKGLIKKGKTQEAVAVSNNDNAVIVSSIDLDKDGIVDVEVAIPITSLEDSDINNESCDINNEADAELNQTLVDNSVAEKEKQ